MVGEWERTTLGQVSISHDSRRIPVKEADRKAGPYPYYGASGVVDHVASYIFNGEYLLIAEDGENLRTRRTPIAFLARGKFWVNNHAHILQGSAKALTRFLHYAVIAADLAPYLTGAVMPKLTQANLQRIPILLPSQEEQEAIVGLLGSLDDKIELNRRTAETLGTSARAVFKSWFVDFDPVRAKADGRPTGLPDDLAALFPSRLVQGPRGDVPEGWAMRPLSDFASAVRGLSYKGEGLASAGLPLHNLNSIYEGGGYKHEGLKFYSGAYATRHEIRPGDIIVANTEQGHERRLIGFAAIVPALGDGPNIFSQHLYRLRLTETSPVSVHWLCHLLNASTSHSVVSGYANGSTVNMLPLEALQEPLFITPPPSLIRVFDVFAQALHDHINNGFLQSQTLANIRDRLLPKLISGELTLAHAEQRIAAA